MCGIHTNTPTNIYIYPDMKIHCLHNLTLLISIVFFTTILFLFLFLFSLLLGVALMLILIYCHHVDAPAVVTIHHQHHSNQFRFMFTQPQAICATHTGFFLLLFTKVLRWACLSIVDTIDDTPCSDFHGIMSTRSMDSLYL